MVATVIDGGKTGVMASLFGFRDHSNDMNVVKDLVGIPYDSVRESLSNSLTQLNQAYMGSETINMGRMITMRHNAIFDPTALTIIDTHNIQNINHKMKEIVMSHPEVIRLNNLGFINGFASVTPDDSLVDWVNDGIINLDNLNMEYTTYNGELDDIYDDLDKHIITSTWHNIQNMLAKGIDPTSEDLDLF